MTVDELKIYYADLLVLQYKEKPNATAHIKALAEQILINLLPLDIQAAFDIDTAVGEQLTWIAKYVGLLSRTIDFGGPYVLDDDELRFIIPFLSIRNSSGSSFKEIKELMFSIQPDNMKIFDNQTMKLTYYVLGGITIEIAILQSIDALPRPAGVSIYPIISLDSLEDIYSFRTYDRASAPVYTFGMSTYDDLPNSSKWITYNDRIL